MRSLTATIRRSLVYYRRNAVNQIVIVALLSAVISGSLFTGDSVRSSLKKNASEKLGSTEIVISSGLRYFHPALAAGLSERSGEKCAVILEADGYSQNFATGATALNTRIYGITEEFWRFHGLEPVVIEPGTAAINLRLAEETGVSEGDDIIIVFRESDPIPENAPFAPSEGGTLSKVMRVGKILATNEMGNFSLGISQVNPLNIFINLSETTGDITKKPRVNRLLVTSEAERTVSAFTDDLRQILTPADIGLSVRKSSKTGEPEIISDRIFIDSALVSGITSILPSASPTITYLGNNMQLGQKAIPYSFITASSYREQGGNEIIINRWAADDLDARSGDTLLISWYDPDYRNQLSETSGYFIISDIVGDDHQYADPSLMPEFPGISGSATCSSWDAGVPLLMEKIRDKDEQYWNRYQGTPKAFISYETGKKIWGSNFGPATALRFPPSDDPDTIFMKLSGSLDPLMSGFTVISILQKTGDAASNGVNFSTLFLGLSFFIILSCLILLSLAVSMFFDSRKDQVKTLFALGFRNNSIRNLLFTETMIISLTGAIPGVLLGYLFNIIIVDALNSVWKGAVQTNTLSPDLSITTLITGFIATIIVTAILLLVKARRYLKQLSERKEGRLKSHSGKKNLFFLIIFLAAAAIFFTLSMGSSGHTTEFSFNAGALLFLGLTLMLRQYYIRYRGECEDFSPCKPDLSRKFYQFNPAHAITPTIFIAAGIFAVIITGANRQEMSEKMLMPSGGTGGFMFWAETAVPVRENLSTEEGRNEFGLNEPDLIDLMILPAKRLPGDDASCLNLNHITAPPILGIEPDILISKGLFSFVSSTGSNEINPWSLLNEKPAENTIYGIADQTVLQWGLRIKTGDTLVYRAENGQPLNIVICAGLKSSVFQGYILTGRENFDKYFTSVPGSSVFLIDGKLELTDLYRETLSDRFSHFGMSVVPASEKLASFFVVTNTYLDVFMILGVLGLILGVAGLGFVLHRNLSQRKREFALMTATGYTIRQIRSLIMKEHVIILLWGMITGTVSGMTATLQSLRSGSELPWNIIVMMILLVLISGISAILISVRSVKSSSLVSKLRKE